MNARGAEHPTELISALVDDEVTVAERQTVEAHLAQCATCRALHRDLSALAAAHRELAPPPVPDGLAERIGASLGPRPSTRTAAARRRWWPRALPLAAAASLLAAVALGVLFRRTLWEETKVEARAASVPAPASVAADRPTVAPRPDVRERISAQQSVEGVERPAPEKKRAASEPGAVEEAGRDFRMVVDGISNVAHGTAGEPARTFAPEPPAAPSNGEPRAAAGGNAAASPTTTNRAAQDRIELGGDATSATITGQEFVDLPVPERSWGELAAGGVDHDGKMLVRAPAGAAAVRDKGILAKTSAAPDAGVRKVAAGPRPGASSGPLVVKWPAKDPQQALRELQALVAHLGGTTAFVPPIREQQGRQLIWAPRENVPALFTWLRERGAAPPPPGYRPPADTGAPVVALEIVPAPGDTER